MTLEQYFLPKTGVGVLSFRQILHKRSRGVKLKKKYIKHSLTYFISNIYRKGTRLKVLKTANLSYIYMYIWAELKWSVRYCRCALVLKEIFKDTIFILSTFLLYLSHSPVY